MSNSQWILVSAFLFLAFVGAFNITYWLTGLALDRFQKYGRVNRAVTRLFSALNKLPGHGTTTSATLNSGKYRIKVEAIKR